MKRTLCTLIFLTSSLCALSPNSSPLPFETLKDTLKAYPKKMPTPEIAGPYFDTLARQIPKALPHAIATQQLQEYCTLIEDPVTIAARLTNAGSSLWEAIAPESKIAIHVACTGKGVGAPGAQYWKNDHVDSKLIAATHQLRPEQQIALSAITQPAVACNRLERKGRSLDLGDTAEDIIAAIGCAACKSHFTKADHTTCTKLCGSGCTIGAVSE